MNLKNILYTAISLLPLTASAAVITAVDFSGDYGTNANSPIRYGDAPELWIDELGDFNGNGTVADTRRYLPINLSQAFLGLSPLEGKNNIIHAGAQVSNFDSSTYSNFNHFRYDGGGNYLQANNHEGTAAMGIAFAPHVRKSEFLNGADAFANVRFADQAAGFTADMVLSGTSIGDGIRSGRLLVQAGADWYISGSLVPTNGTVSVNPYSETWYLIDLSSNMFYNETTGNAPDLATSVTGAALEDIQALGVLMVNTRFDGTNANVGWLSTNNISVAVIPEPSSVALFIGISTMLLVLVRRRNKISF